MEGGGKGGEAKVLQFITLHRGGGSGKVLHYYYGRRGLVSN